MPNATTSSNQQQIIQAVLDESAQALKVTPVTSPADPAYVVVTGKPAVGKGTHDYSATPVTNAAWQIVVASVSAETSEIEIFDSSGQPMVIGTGAPGSEVEQVYDFPGGNGRIALKVNSGTAISVKALNTTASVGYILVNCYGN